MNSDHDFTAIPFRMGGREWAGADCAGVAWLWLQRERGFSGAIPASQRTEEGYLDDLIKRTALKIGELERGDVLFFRSHKRSNRLCHVAIYLGEGRILTTDFHGPKIVNGFELLKRTGLEFAGAISPQETELLCAALQSVELGWSAVIGIVVSIVLSLAAAMLTPKPKIPDMRNQTGRYGFNALTTVSSPEIPLPVILGQMTVAGNAVFQSPLDKSLTVSNPALAALTKIVVWGTGPVEELSNLRVNGVYYTNTGLGYSGVGSPQGLQVAAQNKGEAWDGTFAGHLYYSSYNHYLGAPRAIAPAIDVRAYWDRLMPIYGFNGAAFTVFRFYNPLLYNGIVNTTIDLKGVRFRTFTTAGFDRTSTTTPFTGDGVRTQFLLSFDDIEAVTALTVAGVPFTELSESNLVGNVFHLNRTRGIVTFMTPPAAAAAISITYNYFPNVWSQNPVTHLVFLLTDVRRGKGWDESKIDWVSAVATRDFCDQLIFWRTSDGNFQGPRYISNYAVDFRKPLQAHLAEILNTFYGYLLLSEGKAKIKARTVGTSLFSFSEANILAEPVFKSKLLDRSSRANRVRAFFHTKETLNAETESVRDDLGDQMDREPRIGNDGVVEESLKFLAVNTLGQAERLAEQILRENVFAKWVVEFATNIRGLALEPGDIIDVTHGSQPDWAGKLFRIEAVSLDEKDNPLLTCSEYCDCAYI